LGSGTVTDGSGPGTYTDLVSLFRSYTDVWLQVQVGAETLAPRTKFQSAPSALNASSLGGRNPAYYLDTSSSAQTKSAQLHVFNGDPNGYGIIAEDPNGRGINATGTQYGGVFQAQMVGLFSQGFTGGWFEGDEYGVFSHATGATNLGIGIEAEGKYAGGFFNA